MYVGSSADGSSVYQRLVRSHTDVLLAYFLHKPLLRCSMYLLSIVGWVCGLLEMLWIVRSQRSAAQRSAVVWLYGGAAWSVQLRMT